MFATAIATLIALAIMILSCWPNSKHHSSFPTMHKVRNVGIFVQLLMEINWNQSKAESVSNQFKFTVVLGIKAKAIDFSSI